MNDLLTLDDLAARVGESRKYARDKLVKRADFPRPALVLSQKVRKWALSDFESWLDKQQRKFAR